MGPPAPFGFMALFSPHQQPNIANHLGKTTKNPLVNKLVDPENHLFLMETSLPTPMTARVYVYLLEGNQFAMVFPENSNDLQFLI